MKRAIAVLVAVLVLVAIASEAAVINQGFDSFPTPGLAGYTTYMVSLGTNVGVIEGASLQLTAAGNVLNHVLVGGSVYADLNPFFPPPALPSWDTQVPWKTNVDVLSTLAYEDTSTLQADWAFIGGASNPNAQPITPVLQVVLPDGAAAMLTGEALVGGQMWPIQPTTPIEYLLVSIVGPSIVGPGESITFDSIVVPDIANYYTWAIDSVPSMNSFDFQGSSSLGLSYDYLVNTRGLSLGQHTVGLWAGNVDTGEEGVSSKTFTIIPEPASLALLGLGGMAVAGRRKR